jgi:hypothetical protein
MGGQAGTPKGWFSFFILICCGSANGIFHNELRGIVVAICRMKKVGSCLFCLSLGELRHLFIGSKSGMAFIIGKGLLPNAHCSRLEGLWTVHINRCQLFLELLMMELAKGQIA